MTTFMSMFVSVTPEAEVADIIFLTFLPIILSPV